jgi:membrane glycosyltransferase
VLDFLKRHLRWCQGNLQYLRLRHEPDVLTPKASRFYLWLALELFFSMAGMIAFVLLAAISAAMWPWWVDFPVLSALALYMTWLTIYLLPKIVGFVDAFLHEAERYGGRGRLLLGSGIETLSSFALTPIANLTSTIFMIGLLFGRKAVWNGQARDGYALPWSMAAAALWPQTLAGFTLFAFLVTYAPGAVLWFLPFAIGLMAAIPFAVITSWPALGALAAQGKLLALPEEIDPPAELAAVTPFLRSAPARRDEVPLAADLPVPLVPAQAAIPVQQPARALTGTIAEPTLPPPYPD